MRRLRALTLLAATTAAMLISGPSFAATPVQADAATRALTWLRGQMNPDGSIPGFSLVGGTADAVFAIVAAGQDPDGPEWTDQSGGNPIAFLRSQANVDTPGTDVRDDAALASKVAIAAQISSHDPRNFGGANLITFVRNHYNSTSGQFGTDLFDQAFSLLATRTEGRVPEAVERLIELQDPSGGWEFSPGFGADTNSTSVALQALSAELTATGVTPQEQADIAAAIGRGLGFLDDQQNVDGGFLYQQPGFCSTPPCPSDTNSSSYSIQGIRATGLDPKSPRWAMGESNPVVTLQALQMPDGSFRYDSETAAGDEGSTSQAVPAVLEKSFLCLMEIGSCPTEFSLLTVPQSGSMPLRLFMGTSAVNGFFPYGGHAGGADVAAGDIDGDDRRDLVTAAGPGGGPHIRVLSGATGGELRGFYAYDPAFTGGARIALGDVDGDGRDDIVVGAGPGGGPHVRIFSGATGAELRGFYAYDPAFSGGVDVAAGDFNGDGRADIITAAGPGGGPHIRVFSGATGAELRGFYAYDQAFSGGVNVAAADIAGDAAAEIITGPGAGGGPHVRTFAGRTGTGSDGFYAYDPGFTGGVDVSGANTDGSGKSELVTSAGPGGGPHVRVFDSATEAERFGFFAYPADFSGGVRVAG